MLRSVRSAEPIVRAWGLAILGVYVALLGLLLATVPERDRRSAPGRLVGSLDADDRCLWLDTEAGRIEVIWPPGVIAVLETATVTGPAMAAGPGDLVAVAGFPQAGSPSDACAASGVSVRWLASGVTAVGPSVAGRRA